MTEIDLTGVPPSQRVETRLRVIVIRDYLRIENPQFKDKAKAAAKLNIRIKQFNNLVKAWLLHGEAHAVAKASENPDGPFEAPLKAQNYNIPLTTKIATEDAIYALPVFATNQETIAAVHAMCELRDTPIPTIEMICYLQQIIMSYKICLREKGFIIGRLLVGHPTFENTALPLSEIALAANKSDGRIIAAELVRSADCVSKDFASAVRAVVRKNQQVTIGLDDKVLRDSFIKSRIVSSHSASKILNKILGRHIYDFSLSYKTIASIPQNQDFLTQAYRPPDPQEIEMLEAALKGHNARRKAPPPFFA